MLSIKLKYLNCVQLIFFTIFCIRGFLSPLPPWATTSWQNKEHGKDDHNQDTYGKNFKSSVLIKVLRLQKTWLCYSLILWFMNSLTLFYGFGCKFYLIFNLKKHFFRFFKVFGSNIFCSFYSSYCILCGFNSKFLQALWKMTSKKFSKENNPQLN